MIMASRDGESAGGGGGGALGCLVLTVITQGYHGGDSGGKCQAG